jgi:hypothetical protein
MENRLAVSQASFIWSSHHPDPMPGYILYLKPFT